MMRTILLCTDLDRTLIPNGRQAESTGVRKVFARFVSRPDVSLAYVSGRHLDLIRAAIDEHDLPTPDFAIADVGTSIYHVEDGAWHHWKPWDDEIAPDWQGRTAADVHGMLGDLGGLERQEASKQNTHKLSYYVDLAFDETEVIAAVEQRLAEHDIRARVVWSFDEEQNVGLIDVLPLSASKRHAIEFLMQSGHYDADHAVFAGDSGNDLEVILSPMHSIVVANADDDVRDALAEAEPENTYVAEGGFFGLNGNYAAGILEGVAHFCPEFAPVLEELCGSRERLSA